MVRGDAVGAAVQAVAKRGPSSEQQLPPRWLVEIVTASYPCDHAACKDSILERLVRSLSRDPIGYTICGVLKR